MQRAFILLLALVSSPAALALDQQTLMRAFFSIVLVRGYAEDGSLAYGSGVVIGDHQVVTNCHVLRKTRQAWVSQGEDAYPIVSVQADTRHDLCLLNTDKLPLKAAPLGSSLGLHKGKELFSIGHSNGVLAPLSSRGQIKSLYPYDNGNVVRSSARFSLGASGSALFDDQGRLIGINTFKTPGRLAYFYAIPVEWVTQLAQAPAQTKLPINGQAFWELPDDEKPFFMQVALPRLNDDWPKLLEVSQRWIAAEPGNAEAWYELGSAQENLKQPDAALQSYRKAAELDPQHSEALYRLGVYAARHGDRETTRSIGAKLAAIDPELAADYDKDTACNLGC